MKNLVVFILLQFLISSNSIIQAQWVQTNGLYGLQITYLAVNGTNIFASTYGSGVFLSTNNGTNWTNISNGLIHPLASNVFEIVFSDNNIFAATWDGVYLSTDNGTSWTQVNNGLTNIYVRFLAVIGTNIFAGTDGGGVFRSTNNGTNWTKVNNGLPVIPILNIQDFAVIGTNIFVGMGSVWLSANNGTSWTYPSNDGIYGTRIFLASLAVSGTNIFGGCGPPSEGENGGVCLSTNQGTSWTQVNNGLDNFVNGTVEAFAFSGTDIFADFNYGGVFLSTNNGTNWTDVSDGQINTKGSGALAVSGTNLLAGTWGDGVWTRPLSELTAVTKEATDLPKDFSLSQNYPNPFNPSTIISYSIPSAPNIKLSVYNTLGQTIKILESGYKQSGNYSVNFNASNLPSGIYFYKLEAGQFSQIKKMILIK